MSLLSSSTAQARLSIVVTALLAGFLVWQVRPVTEPVKMTPEEVAKVQRSDSELSPEPKQVTEPAKTPAVVTLPPPPAIKAAPSAKSKPVGPAPEVKLLEPIPDPSLPEPVIKVVKPIRPVTVSKAKLLPDLLASRPALKPQPEPVPQIRPQAAKIKAPTPLKSTPVTRPASTQHQPVHYANTRTASKGRALLRVLEHGKGPTVQISWPEARQTRSLLSQQLRQCFGMQLALMDGRGQLFVAETRRGEPWRPNRDYYSGFVRQTNGRLPEEERQTVRQIRRRHGPVGTEVHIFPRRVDALVLGALQSLVGAAYDKAEIITARYDLTGAHIRIRDFRVDGHSVNGIIDLSGVRHCRGTIGSRAT
jgi:hypothetical protein